MSGYVKPLPQNTATGASETVPWATTGTTLAPTVGEQNTGWQPQAIAGPPDYRLENHARKTQAELNFRANQAALFLEYAVAEVAIAGVAAGVNHRSITINGNTVDYTDQPGDTAATIKDAFVTLINANPLMTGDATASHDNPADPITILGVNPGVNIVVSAAVIAGAGTITVTGPTDCIVRGADSAWYAADVVIGAPEANWDGDPNHAARVLWDKTNACLYTGGTNTTKWDAGNRGEGSVNHGIDNYTPGKYAVGLGNNVQATSQDAVAVAAGSIASATTALAMMGGLAAGSKSIAIGSSASANAAGSNVAIGDTAVAQSESVAIGKKTAATGNGAVAIGDGGAAIGGSVIASHKGAVALGYSEDSLLNITASGNHAFAHGDGSIASGNFSRATGNAAKAEANGERAHSPLHYSHETGHHQQGDITLVARGCATGRVLTTDTLDGSGSRWTIPLNTAYAVSLQCIGTKVGAFGSYVSFVASGLIFNEAGAVTVQGTLLGAIAQEQATNAAGWTLTGSVVGTDYVLTANSNGIVGDAWTCTLRYTKAK